MKVNIATAAFTALMLLGSAEAFAQAGPDQGNEKSQSNADLSSGSFNGDNVRRDKPFGDMTIDQTAPFTPSMFTADQLSEIKGRCDYIVMNKDSYEASTVAYCESTMK
jgi:hypothetical protein